MLRTLPLDRIQELRDVAPYYYEWLQHPADDPFWNFAELRSKYGRTRAAVLNLSGWNDDNYGPEGATTNFVGWSTNGPAVFALRSVSAANAATEGQPAGPERPPQTLPFFDHFLPNGGVGDDFLLILAILLEVVDVCRRFGFPVSLSSSARCGSFG